MNYANITKGFMQFIKKCTPFLWDESAQQYFEALKKALLSTPLLRLLDYKKEFILYLAASKSTRGIVLVQEDDELWDQLALK